MIGPLMQRDVSWKTLSALTLAGAACWFVSGRPSAAFAQQLFGTMLVVLSTIAAWVFLVRQQAHTGFLASLPVTVKDVFAARVLSVLLVLWVPVMAGLTAGALGGLEPLILLRTIAQAAFTSLILLVAQSTLTYRSASFLWLFNLLIFSVILSADPISWLEHRNHWSSSEIESAAFALLLSSALVGIAIFVWTFHSAPAIFHLPGTSPVMPEVLKTNRLTARTRASRPFPLRAYFRSVLPWFYSLWMLILFIQAAGQSGMFGCIYFTFMLTGARPSIRWLQMLPVSRSVLVASMLAPPLLLMNAGFLIGASYFPRSQGTPIRVTQQSCGKPGFTMPMSHWREAPRTGWPVITAPWGETYEPPVLTTDGRSLYNPFAVSCQNSQRFITWQFNRAYEANRAGPPFHLQLVRAAALTGTALLFTLITVLNEWYRLRKLKPAVRLSLLGAVWAGLYYYTFGDSFGATSSVEKLLVQVSLRLPGFHLVALLIPLIALYWLVDKIFREGEAPDGTPPSRFGVTA